MTLGAGQPGRRRAPAPQEKCAIGPAGWAAFATTNCTALGIIGAMTVISWSLSVVACALYTVVLIAVATYLDIRSYEYRQVVNFLWVLACAALFALGAMMAGAPGPLGGPAVEEITSVNSTMQATPVPTPAPTPSPSPPLSNDLTQVLPPNSGEDLLAWARDDSEEAALKPSFSPFNGAVWFSAMDAEGNETVLWRVKADGGSRPYSKIVSPRSFVLFRERLYFSATQRGAGETLWFVRDHGTDKPEVAAGEVFESAIYTAVKQLFVVGEGSSELLYLKVEYLCANSGERVASILQFSTISESVDLRPGVCATRESPRPAGQLATTDAANDDAVNASPAAAAGDNVTCSTSPNWLAACCGSDRKQRAWHARLWGALLLADLPMMALATVVLALRRMPGLFVNLFAGVWLAVTAALVLAWDLDHGGFVALQRDLLLLYTALLWAGILLLTVLVPHPPEWLEELRQWAIKCTAPTFLGAMHLKLGIPATSIYWRWVVYALLVVAHVPAAALVRDPLPVLLSMIGLFVLAWKNSHLLSDITGTQNSPTAELVFMIASMCLQGTGILAGGVACLSNLQQSQDIVAQVLQGCKLNWLQASEQDEYYED